MVVYDVYSGHRNDRKSAEYALSRRVADSCCYNISSAAIPSVLGSPSCAFLLLINCQLVVLSQSAIQKFSKMIEESSAGLLGIC